MNLNELLEKEINIEDACYYDYIDKFKDYEQYLPMKAVEDFISEIDDQITEIKDLVGNTKPPSNDELFEMLVKVVKKVRWEE